MQEEFLHYLFEYQLIENTEFEIISPGLKNNDSGPDFFNSKIRIGETVWAGNVEIHINASDWHKHGHQKDKAYDNIILHLVLKNDKDIFSTKGELIPAFEIKYNSEIYKNYNSLISNSLWVHCEKELPNIDTLTKISFLDKLAIDRLQRKTEFFDQLLEYNNNNWEETFFQALAKGFGGKVNNIPFELLSKSVSLNTILKNRGNILSIEAILYGQSGLLEDDSITDSYYSKLQNEYKFLKQKYQLEAIRPELWKFSKIRPYNFPTIKISLIAQLLNQYNSLFSKVIDCKTIIELETLFEIKASEYWEEHYTFGKASKSLSKRIGKSSKHNLIINTIIPFVYVYATQTNKEELKERCIDWLIAIPPEKNNITKKWEERGFENKNAMESQALIELKNEKCSKHLCLDCRIAHKILTLSWLNN